MVRYQKMVGYQNFKAHFGQPTSLIRDYDQIRLLAFYNGRLDKKYIYDEKGNLTPELVVENGVLRSLISFENYYWMDDKPLREYLNPIILKLQELFSRGDPRGWGYLPEQVRKERIMVEIGRMFRYKKKMWKEARALVGMLWGWNSSGVCSKVLLEKRCENPNCEENDRVYIQALSCGRMDCPICGQPYSLAHLECYLKFVPVLIALRKRSSKGILGLLVITFPAEKRMELADKEALSKIRTAIRDLLCPGEKPNKVSKEIAKKYGIKQYPAIFDVWHFAGEESSPRYHPHLNIVVPVEKGYWNKDYLEKVRQAIRELSERVLGFPCNVWYGYKTRGVKVKGALIDTDSKLLHLARYLSRGTFLMQNEVPYEAFKNFQKYGHRGLRGYLNEDNEPKTAELVKEMVEMMIENGEIKSERQRIDFLVRMNRCPSCYEKMMCRRIRSFEEVYEEGDKVVEVSGVLYIIIKKIKKDNRPPPEELSEDYWEPGMSDLDYITEEEIKKALEEIEQKKK
jgi:hypothetical protein